ncbi:MAG: insulinase family protein [Polyangiaceae bacterium]|nr:insulinase family protein [Polyangiaceae bacterium]
MGEHGYRHLGSHAFGPDMRVERYRLDNGLRLLFLRDERAPVFCYETWFDVGSRHEQPGRTGIAHFFEHLMFQETETLPYGELDRRYEEAGAEINAATYLDWTYYVINAPREALPLVIATESERMHRLTLAPEHIESEREVVLNERRQVVDDDVEGAASELLFRTAFQAHGYGHPTIGSAADIAGFQREDCLAFYRTHYAPNNAVVVVVGDVAPAELLGGLVQGYGPIAPAELPVEDVRPEPPQQAERRVELHKPTPHPKLGIGYHAPAFGDVDHAPLVLLNEILTGGRASRLYRRLVTESELASLVRGVVGSFRDPSLFELWLTARTSAALPTLAGEVDLLLEAVVREPVSARELERAKARAELGSLQGLETVGGKAEQLGFGEIVLGDPCVLWSRLEAFRRATRADLLRVARRYLGRDNRSVVTIWPQAGEAESEAAQ